MSRYANRSRDIVYMLFVKSLPCYVGIDCSGEIEADHAGDHGIGRKGDDCKTIPLCKKHHAERHAHAGYFRDFDKIQMREWKANAIAKTQSRWGKQ